MLHKHPTLLSRFMLPATLGLVLWTTASVAQAEVYKWVGPDGSIQYGDTPPESAKVQKIDGSLSVIPPVSHSSDPSETSGNTSTRTRNASGGSGSNASAAQPSYAEVMAEAHRKAVERCERNRGIDCEEEADAQTYPSYSQTYVTPYWNRPLPVVWPRPAVTPPQKTTTTKSSRHWSKQTDESQQ